MANDVTTRSELKKSGYLKKNHKGSTFEKKSFRRWFVSDGFYVNYYAAESKSKACGRFDLRNVTEMKTSPTVPNTLIIRIADKKDKDMVISFADVPNDEAAWKKLWCSAVAAPAIAKDAELLKYRDETLALTFNDKFSAQGALPVSKLKSSMSAESLYSPRRQPTAEEFSKCLPAKPAEPPPPALSPVVEPQAQALPTDPCPSSGVNELPQPAEPAPEAEVEATPAADANAQTEAKAQAEEEAKTEEKAEAEEKVEAETKVEAEVEPGANAAGEATEEAEGGAEGEAKAEPEVPMDDAPRDDPPEGEGEDGDESVLVVDVPAGVVPGDKLRVTAPNGVKVLVTVPEGAVSGSQLEFALPEEAAAMPSTTAPEVVDTAEQPEDASPQPPIGDPPDLTPSSEAKASLPDPPDALTSQNEEPKALDEGSAAVLLQSGVRGHNARWQLQEHRRQTWLAHYLQPYVSEFDKAYNLAVTAEEVGRIDQAKQAYDQRKNMKEIQALVAERKTTEARKLGWDGKNPPPLPEPKVEGFNLGIKCFSKSEDPPIGDLDDNTDAAAVKVQSVYKGYKTRFQEQERRRTEWLSYYKRTGQFDEALEMSISEEEVDEIEQLRKIAADPNAVSAATKVQSALRGKNARDSLNETARLEWLKFYMDTGEYDKAQEMCISEAEMDEVNAQRVLAGGGGDASKAAVLLQSAERGRKAREDMKEQARLEWLTYYKTAGDFKQAMDLTVTDEEEAEVARLAAAAESSPELAKAATKLQGAARGHLARTEVQEASRKEWLKYFTDSGEYDKALELCVTDGEEEEINQLRLAKQLSEPNGGPADDNTEEYRRTTWLNYYKEEGEWDKALELCVTQDEEAQIKEKRDAGGPVDDDTEEYRRTTWLKHYTEEGEWDKALELCVTQDEEAQIKEKRDAGGPVDDDTEEYRRTTWLKHYTDVGKYEEALELCVTQDEEAKVKEKRDAGGTGELPSETAEVDDATEEHRRSTWLSYYIAEGKYEEALDLCVTQAEEASVAQKQEEARLLWLSYHEEEGDFTKALEMCVTAEEEAKIIALMSESEKAEAFVTAIKAYDWELATQLASTQQERDDLAGSISRVADMKKFKDAGDIEQALKLAITQQEEADILASQESKVTVEMTSPDGSGVAVAMVANNK